jgi:hypothetical protein
VTSANKKFIKGANTIPASDFFPTPKESDFPAKSQPPQELPPSAPPATNYGTYSGVSYRNNITETVELQPTSFRISDNSGDGDGFLSFRIDSWEEIPSASLPAAANTGGYTGGYKFKGKITGQKGYVPSNQTAPAAAGFSSSDVNGPDCWMSIYFKGETGDITFIRTPFSKTSTTAGVVENNTAADGGNGLVRTYTKAN